MKYTLGLDIGSKSIGWALVKDSSEHEISNIGVRVFPEGVDRDTKGAEKSKNEKRRDARGARRNRWRKRMRKDKLVKILRAKQLLPQSDNELEKLFIKDPYQLRTKGLDKKLEPFELGRVIFHLNQRRGFKSNRKSDKGQDGIVKKSATELQNKIDTANCRTLGEYFHKTDTNIERIRGNYTFRSMYEQEIEAIWNKQKEYYNEILNDEFKKQLLDETIFYQRPLKPPDHLIGNCELEPDQPRCPKGDWLAIKFRILQTVNNLKVQNPDGTERKLNEDQRQQLLEMLYSKKEVKFDDLRKKFGFYESQKFNLENNGKAKTIKGDEFASFMSSILGKKAWQTLTIEKKIQLNQALLELEDDELEKFMAEKFGLDEKSIEKVFKIPLPQKYMSFSKKAIETLLPFMEKGSLTHEAVEKAGYINNNGFNGKEQLDQLPLPDDLKNPLVNKALVEVRKLVNAIISEYGKPAKIKLEMARDMKGSLQERQEQHFKMLENEKINANARKELIENIGILKPSREDIIKYKLWQECARLCPFTGKPISQNALFGPEPQFQIEHILPYSRSLDDGYMNKTLCWVEENRLKGNQTPFEFYNGTENFDLILKRIEVLPYPKRKRFWQKEIELDKCIQRELNDTRYICRQVVGYLKQLGVTVTGTKGKSTDELRHSWGLNNILDLTGAGVKNRDDHRHHAVDAAVVAITTQKHLKDLASTKYSEKDRMFPQPWEGFREELEEKVNKIIVSHRATKRARGQLHEETNYGPTGRKDERGQDIFVYRKALESLTVAMVPRIVDPVVKNIVIERLSKFGIDINSKAKIGKEVWAEPLYMPCSKKDENGNPVKVPIKRVRIETVSNNMIMLKDTNGKTYRGVEPGNNHHISVYQLKNGKKTFEVISLYEAIKRKTSDLSIVNRTSSNEKCFMFSLAANDMFMLKVDQDYIPHRVQKIIQDGRIVLRPHTYAGKISDSDNPPLIQRKNYNTIEGYKIHIDRLGRIFPAND